ncbi:hypothetical protein ABKV19_007542 [Rosa sericea]
MILSIAKFVLYVCCFSFITVVSSRQTYHGSFSCSCWGNPRLAFLKPAMTILHWLCLFADAKIEDFIHMDLGMEFNMNKLKEMSTDEGISVINDDEDINDISRDKELIRDTMEEIAREGDA